MSTIVCLGRHTITGLLCTNGAQFVDWTKFYRLFSAEQFDQDYIFGVLRDGVVEQAGDARPLVVAMDDTIVRKTGKNTPGVSYRRDPLGPPFQTNLVLAQRFLQLSAIVPADAASRAIPIDFQHAPTPKKPSKKASDEEIAAYNEARRESNISLLAVERLQALRDGLDATQPSHPVHVVVDGRYTNKTVMRSIPANTVLTGRVRADTKLFYPPQQVQHEGAGRTRWYGDRAPTPEQLRTDDTVAYEQISVTASGASRTLRIKTIGPVLWKVAGHQMPLRLIVIAPTGYRLRKGSRLLYRKPAYLITTDMETPVEQIVQHYVWRWDIEVNFRDEKQMFGVGQAQVRNKASVQSAPALAVASYATLLLSAIRAYGAEGKPSAVPPPKWLAGREKPRGTTADIRQAVRTELWGRGIGNFDGFTFGPPPDMKPPKFTPRLLSAACYALS